MELDEGLGVPVSSQIASTSGLPTPSPDQGRNGKRGGQKTAGSTKKKKKGGAKRKDEEKVEDGDSDELDSKNAEYARREVEGEPMYDEIDPEAVERQVRQGMRGQKAAEAERAARREQKDQQSGKGQGAGRAKVGKPKLFRGVRQEVAGGAVQAEGRYTERVVVVDGLSNPAQFRSPVAIRRVMSRQFSGIAVHTARILPRGGISLLCATEKDAANLLKMESEVVGRKPGCTLLLA